MRMLQVDMIEFWAMLLVMCRPRDVPAIGLITYVLYIFPYFVVISRHVTRDTTSTFNITHINRISLCVVRDLVAEPQFGSYRPITVDHCFRV